MLKKLQKVYQYTLIGFGIFLATAFSCAKGPVNDSAVIVASIAPIADIAQNIAGNSINTISAVPFNANPHTFEPDPSTVKSIQNAKLFIGVHPEFDGWISRMVSVKGKIYFLSDMVSGDNPHVWLSVKNARRIAPAIRDMLAAQFPEKAEMFSENFAAYDKKLSALDGRIATMFSNVKHKKFIQWHPAWNYFAADYGLDIAGSIESGHGDAPSIKSFRDLKARAIKDGIKIVVIDYYASSQTAEAFVREIGGKEVRLDGIGNPQHPDKAHYLALMEYNARVLAQALSE